MSSIADALAKAREVFFLVEIDFEGLIARWAIRDISVADSAGADRKFEAAILQPFDVATNFDIRVPRYSMNAVSMQVQNKGRLQDELSRRRLDGARGRIYAWCDGLTWQDIEPACRIFQGAFVADEYDRHTYSFHLADEALSKFHSLPGTTINADTWPSHRTEGGGGSVAGLPQALVFGDWPKGVPLRCVDTAAFKYGGLAGVAKSVDADYTAATKAAYNKDGSTIGPANYTFYPGGLDGEGNLVAYFDMTADQSASEPLSCSIEGLADGSGEITGATDTLIEHPAHTVHYLALYHSDYAVDEIDIESIKTMRSLLPGVRFASIINAAADGVNIVDRILSQCQCARLPRAGRFGVMVFNTAAVDVGRIDVDREGHGRPKFWKTPEDMLCNDLLILYGLNPTTGKYEGRLVRDRSNNADCQKSERQYGRRPQQELKLPDVQEEATAIICADRRLAVAAYRHDVMAEAWPYAVGMDYREGDAGLVTAEDGPSRDGSGWSDEKCLLIERRFGAKTISQTWWRINTG